MSEQQRKDKPEPYSMADIANRAAETMKIATSRADLLDAIQQSSSAGLAAAQTTEILTSAAQAAESFRLSGIAQEFAGRELKAAEPGLHRMIERLQVSTLALSDPLRELTEQQAEIARLLGPSELDRITRGIQADYEGLTKGIDHENLSTSSRLIAGLDSSAMLLSGQTLIERFQPDTWLGYEVLFPRPHRRPEPKPPTEPIQSVPPERQESELLEQVAEALFTGQIKPAAMAKTLATVLQAPRGPKQADSEWTEARVVSMWLDWQAHSRDLTAEAFAQRRWLISKGYMYRLFRQYGLMQPVRKRGKQRGH